ncbi:hypothetical protein C8F04DRAFT_1272534 [Mycena alexandri]|uniref:Uncharacterized protein n=1 Tax=Mycena alexandri TaxID=1745969 RepID=A0AAD6SBK5_9AGAR|nr:hypothetical protein C8F04DRAFT_1272532 [Mycena alexandri]KAJ7022527.1 hypothetical protein C8F04DRAFT_1272534 [Mycena alexandri]
MSSAGTEVPYTAEDLNVRKPALIALVQRQVAKWPGGDFNPKDKKITVDLLQKVLGDPIHGFTKHNPESVCPISPIPAGSDDVSEKDKEPEFNVKYVKLLIQDSRTSAKTSQQVALFVLDTEGCGEGEWRADLKDLLEELQTSMAALQGSYRLGIRDPDDPEYRTYFAKVTEDSPWDKVEPIPPCVIIPRGDCLDIFVEHVEDTSSQKIVQTPGTFNSNDPAAKPLEVARHRVANAAGATGSVNADVAWLAEEIKTLPGYSDFNENRHKVQQNVGVVASWKFVALVSKTYFGNTSHIPSRNGKKKITKGSIHQAVGLRSTAFTQAEHAVRIIDRYGEGGSSPAQTIIERIALVAEKPEGAKGLYPFLVGWEKEHGSNST